MGLFCFFFGEKIENENKFKPFHKNVNAQERRDWFSRTRPYHKVNPKIIDTLIEKFGEDPMFEVFVITSMEQNLIKRYAQINKDIYDDANLTCCLISKMLYEVGSVAAKKVFVLVDRQNRNELFRQYNIVLDSVETAIILYPKQISAYSLLATVKGLLHKYEEGLKYAKQGLAVLREMKASDAPFHLSEIDAIKNANQSLDVMEKGLTGLIERFEEQLSYSK